MQDFVVTLVIKKFASFIVFFFQFGCVVVSLFYNIPLILCGVCVWFCLWYRFLCHS